MAETEKGGGKMQDERRWRKEEETELTADKAANT
jgi:hypothetical protein